MEGGSYGITQSTVGSLCAKKVLTNGQREIGEACEDEVGSGQGLASLRNWRGLRGQSEGYSGDNRVMRGQAWSLGEGLTSWL